MPGAGPRLITTAFTEDQFPLPDQPEVVMAGRSNVGKSLLINRLSGLTPRQSRTGGARVSSRPGCTRSVNFYSWVDHAWLVDLPGYGYAHLSGSDRQAIRQLVETYFRSRAGAAVIVQVVDIRLPLQPADRQLLEWSRPLLGFHLLALNKCDKLTRSAAQNRVRALTTELAEAGYSARCIPVSAADGTGVEILRGAIREAVRAWPQRSDPHAV